MDLYEKNFSELHKVSPIFAEAMQKAKEALLYEVFIEQENIETLNLVHTQSFKPLYDAKPHDILITQRDQYKQYQTYPYLYFFGFGNGVLLYELLQNIEHKRILVIEPDPSIVYIVFHLIDFSEALKNGRLVLVASSQISKPNMAGFFSKLEEQKYVKLYDLHIMSSYYETYHDIMMKANRAFIEGIQQIIAGIGNDAIDSLIGMEHHFMNLPLMLQTPSLFELIKKAKNTEIAVLASTGPSLAKQLPLLKEITPYVTIVAVDASFPVLTRHGIKPDIVVSMERVPLTGRFFKDTPKEAFDGVIFALSSLQHPEVIDNIKGGVIQMSMRPFGYMTLPGPQEWGYIGMGMSAANMAYELIYHSHFHTCVLIGQDLAYGEDGMSHSSGHLFGQDEVKQNKNDGWVEAYGGGKKIRTIAVWNMFRGFFEKDIRDTKESMLTINATEGGARIHGALELPFAEVIKTKVDQFKVKKPIVLKKIKPKELKNVKDLVEKKLKIMIAYIAKQREGVESLFLQIATVCEKADQEKMNLSELQALQKQIYDFRSVTETEMFKQAIWHIAQSMLMPYEIEIAKIEVRSTSTEEEAYQKLLDWMKVYQKWFFGLAGCIDAIQTAMKRKGSHYERQRRTKANAS
ncbi:motility associated factor glycosyltransferase family protein [Sulfurospirillum halorespirans]|uniref:6-hydroxymethylpterin diphosphokinase MptE-like domain-containing protein n=1 Tax=Sulfurospirillum halorespirans DSM 13726 TaxID=1193502 RepID=A0A1D7TNV5_9BACT|nr:6-hydroxymethylpterin diphosphokinase MptE-like protein [Sulfurospirillum halorespirans]AOO66679.1 hypothetical protein SHALO_2927 [Sulfurospirillum halorespirans DSM 13726]